MADERPSPPVYDPKSTLVPQGPIRMVQGIVVDDEDTGPTSTSDPTPPESTPHYTDPAELLKKRDFDSILSMLGPQANDEVQIAAAAVLQQQQGMNSKQAYEEVRRRMGNLQTVSTPEPAPVAEPELEERVQQQLETMSDVPLARKTYQMLRNGQIQPDDLRSGDGTHLHGSQLRERVRAIQEQGIDEIRAQLQRENMGFLKTAVHAATEATEAVMRYPYTDAVTDLTEKLVDAVGLNPVPDIRRSLRTATSPQPASEEPVRAGTRVQDRINELSQRLGVSDAKITERVEYLKTRFPDLSLSRLQQMVREGTDQALRNNFEPPTAPQTEPVLSSALKQGVGLPQPQAQGDIDYAQGEQVGLDYILRNAPPEEYQRYKDAGISKIRLDQFEKAIKLRREDQAKKIFDHDLLY